MIRPRTLCLYTFVLATLSLHAATFTVTNTNDSGAGSLRQAILDANDAAGPDRIEFAIGSGPQLIAPLTPLPEVTGSAIIDATTQPGYVNAPLIGLDGSNLPPVQYVTAGFRLVASSSAVIGFSITNFRADATIGREGAGVVIGASGCLVLKCYLGLQRNGISAGGNTSGVRIDEGGSTIGAPGQGNVISGNNRGIDHLGLSPTAPTTVQNNIIGLSANGLSDVPNVYGMLMVSDIVINNRIAGNSYDDIDMIGPNSIIRGNKIGIRADGSRNSLHTVTASVVIYTALSQQADNVRLGGSGPGEGNEIASGGPGVYVQGGSNVQIVGNNIHDSLNGIMIDQSPGTKITGNTIHDNFGAGLDIRSGAGNLISANSFYGNSSGIELESGANFGIAYPVVTGAASANGSTTIQGTFDGNGSSSYKIELFASPACSGAGRGEGKTYLGSTNVTTNGAGHATFSALFGSTSLAQGSVVTATATDSGNNTSEFSACATVQGPGNFSISSSPVTEGTGATITVTRSGSSGSATVDYATANDTAIAGSDYTAKSGTLTFADGETQKTINVATTDDSLYEAAEGFFINLSNPTGGAAIAVSSARVTINDNDVPPTATIDDVSVVRPAGGAVSVTFTVHLSSASGAPAILNYGTVNGSAINGIDYQGTSGSITFSPGQTSKTIDVIVLASSASAPDKEFTLDLSAISGVSPASLTAHCTIFAHNVGIAPASQSIANGEKGRLTVSFAKALTADATLTVRSSKPESFSAPATVPAAAGATNVSFQVTALLAPATAKIEVTLPAAIGGDVLTASVSSYEKATLILQPSPVSVIAGGSATVSATLTPASDQPQVIALEDTDPSIADAPTAVTIPAGGSGTFSVAGIRKGETSVRATLPARYGSQTTVLVVDVLDTPTTPVIFSVSPATGPATGGSPVSAAGVRLRADCALAFGGTPAQTTFVNETQLSAITPAHTPGTVDVRLTCTQDSYVLSNAFTFLAAAPSISSITPGFGNIAGGTIVRLAGTNLSDTCGVFFGGRPAHNVDLDGPALIATAPEHQAGAVDVTVKCGGESATRTGGFTYSTSEEPAAAISSIDPLFGSAGQSVAVTGLRFRAGDRVTFGTTPAVILSTTNDTHIVRIPDVPLGKIAVNLTDPNDRVTTTGPIFTIVDPVTPKITLVAPAVVRSGAELMIDGEGFRTGYSFAIGDRAAVTLSMSYNKAIVRVPALDPGTYHVNVINAGGNVSSVGPSIAVATGGVAITGISASCSSTDGGGSAVIQGNGFATGATVLFGDVAANVVVVLDAQTITVTVPASPVAGMVGIKVTNPNGDSGTLSNAFRYTSPYDPDGCGSRRRAGGRG